MMFVLAMQPHCRGWRNRRTNRDHVRRQLAAPDRADHQLRPGLRAALLPRLQADPADARRGASYVSGLANAERSRRNSPASTPSARRCSRKANADGQRLIEEARMAAVRLQAAETGARRRRGGTDPAARARGRRPRARRDARRAPARRRTPRRAGHGQRHRQDPDSRRSPAAGRGDRTAAASWRTRPPMTRRQQGHP